MKFRSTIIGENHWATHLSYTALAILVLVPAYTFLSAVVIPSFVARGSLLSIVLNIFSGVAMLFFVEPLRQLLQVLMRVFMYRRHIEYWPLHHKILAAFVGGGDVFSVTEDIRQLLRHAYALDDVRVTIRFAEHRFYEVSHDERQLLDAENPIVQYVLQLSDSEIDHLLHDVPRQEELSQLSGFFGMHDVVYILPLVIDKQVVGWISFHDHNHQYRFLRDDYAFFHLIQSVLSLGFRRLRMNLQLNRRIDTLEKMNTISQLMNSSLHVHETLDMIMDTVTEFARVDRAVLFQYDSAEHMVAAQVARGFSSDVELDTAFSPEGTIFGHCMEQREAIVVTNPDTDTRYNQRTDSMFGNEPFIVVPMMVREEIIGFIRVDTGVQHKPIADVNLALLTTLANQAAIALVNSRLHEQLQEKGQAVLPHFEATDSE